MKLSAFYVDANPIVINKNCWGKGARLLRIIESFLGFKARNWVVSFRNSLFIITAILWIELKYESMTYFSLMISLKLFIRIDICL